MLPGKQPLFFTISIVVHFFPIVIKHSLKNEKSPYSLLRCQIIFRAPTIPINAYPPRLSVIFFYCAPEGWGSLPKPDMSSEMDSLQFCLFDEF